MFIQTSAAHTSAAQSSAAQTSAAQTSAAQTSAAQTFWKDQDAFERAFARLLSDLRAEETAAKE
jgi:cytochrome c556